MRYLSSKNVAEILGINISTLKRWTDNGTLDCTKTAGGHRKFTMQNIRDFHKNQENIGKNPNLGIESRDHKKIYSCGLSTKCACFIIIIRNIATCTSSFWS